MSARAIRPREWAGLAVLLAAAFVLGAWLRGGQDIGRDVSEIMDVETLQDAPGFPASGPADAPVTILVFSDYDCPICQAAEPRLEAAARQAGGVRIVQRDWPVLGPLSLRAARVALAADRQGLYAQIHAELMQGGSLSEDRLRSVVEEAGGDWSRIEADLSSHGEEIDALLARTRQDAFQLGFPGTPGYLIGPIRIAGGASERQFRKAIEHAKSAS